MGKRKPSFFLILVHVTTEKLLALFLAIVSAGLGFEQWKNGASMIQAWFWWVFAIFILILVISGAVREYQKELESYNSQNETSNRYEKSPHTEGNHIGNNVYGDTKNFNSNNTSNTSIGTINFGSEDRTKKDLRLQIGVELQVFSRAFQDVVEAKHRDLRETLDKSDHIFEKIKSDLLYRANLLLTDTRIPANLIELAKYYDEYSLNVLIHHTIEEKIHSYLIGGRTIKEKRSQVPQELDDEAREYRISADAGQLTIQIIIADTLKLCKE